MLKKLQKYRKSDTSKANQVFLIKEPSTFISDLQLASTMKNQAV